VLLSSTQWHFNAFLGTRSMWFAIFCCWKNNNVGEKLCVANSYCIVNRYCFVCIIQKCVQVFFRIMHDHVQHDNQPLYAWKNLFCYWIFIVIVFQQIIFVASFQQEVIIAIPQPSFPPWVAIPINVIKDIVDPFSKHKKLVFNNIFLILRHKFYIGRRNEPHVPPYDLDA
jgi:hypothetical protein